MRKLVSLFLVLAMMLAMIPGALAEEPYKLDIYWVGNGDNTPVREGVEKAINAYVEPLIGCTVEIHMIGWNDWNEKAVNALQTGEKIDLIFTADWLHHMVEATSGLLLPLDDLLVSDGQGILDNLPDGFIQAAKIDNVLYAIPTNKEMCVPLGLVINKTAANEIGWDVQAEDPSITCTADLEPWLAKYKEKYPDKYPYLLNNSDTYWTDEPWIPGWDGNNRVFMSQKMAMQEDGTFDETVYSIYETPEQEEHIRLMYDWCQKGYINPEHSLIAFDPNPVFGRGDFLVYTQPLKGNGIKAMELYNSYHTRDFEFVEKTMQPKYICTTHTGGSAMFGIPVTSKNPQKAMQFLALNYSDPTLVNLMVYGEEGVNYTKIDENTIEVNPNANWLACHAGPWSIGNTAIQYVTAGEDPEKSLLLQHYGDDAIATASLGFRFLKDNVVNEIAAVDGVVLEYCCGLMCGVVDPDDPDLGIEAMKAALKDAGIDAIIAEATAQYQAWKAGKAE